MLNPKIQDAFNEHINAELFSDYLYLSMANWFTSKNFDGMASWMKQQAAEERGHGMKFIDFVHDRGGIVLFKAISEPKVEWGSPEEAFKEAYEHECLISNKIHALVDLARDEKDKPAENFLQWFVSEQVEEESTALTIYEKFQMIGDNMAAHFMLDAQLGSRGAAPGGHGH